VHSSWVSSTACTALTTRPPLTASATGIARPRLVWFAVSDLTCADRLRAFNACLSKRSHASPPWLSSTTISAPHFSTRSQTVSIHVCIGVSGPHVASSRTTIFPSRIRPETTMPVSSDVFDDFTDGSSPIRATCRSPIGGIGTVTNWSCASSKAPSTATFMSFKHSRENTFGVILSRSLLILSSVKRAGHVGVPPDKRPSSP